MVRPSVLEVGVGWIIKRIVIVQISITRATDQTDTAWYAWADLPAAATLAKATGTSTILAGSLHVVRAFRSATASRRLATVDVAQQWILA